MSTVQVKHNTTAGCVPLATELATAELAVNLADRVLYTKDATGHVITIGGSSGGGTGGNSGPVAAEDVTGLSEYVTAHSPVTSIVAGNRISVSHSGSVYTISGAEATSITVAAADVTGLTEYIAQHTPEPNLLGGAGILITRSNSGTVISASIPSASIIDGGTFSSCVTPIQPDPAPPVPQSVLTLTACEYPNGWNPSSNTRTCKVCWSGLTATNYPEYTHIVLGYQYGPYTTIARSSGTNCVDVPLFPFIDHSWYIFLAKDIRETSPQPGAPYASANVLRSFPNNGAAEITGNPVCSSTPLTFTLAGCRTPENAGGIFSWDGLRSSDYPDYPLYAILRSGGIYTPIQSRTLMPAGNRIEIPAPLSDGQSFGLFLMTADFAARKGSRPQDWVDYAVHREGIIGYAVSFWLPGGYSKNYITAVCNPAP